MKTKPYIESSHYVNKASATIYDNIETAQQVIKNLRKTFAWCGAEPITVKGGWLIQFDLIVGDDIMYYKEF